MKVQPYILLLIAACASCHREEAPQAAAGAEHATKAPAPAASAFTAEKTPPKPLLKTANITIFPGGKGMVYATSVAQNPDAILADIATLPPSEGKDSAMSSVLNTVAKADPAKARELLKQWPDGKVSAWIKVAQEIALALGKTDPAAAREFITQDVPASMQMDVWAAYMHVMPAEDQLSVLDRLPEGHLKLRIAAAMITTWLPDDPAAVAAWLDGFVVGKNSREIDTLDEPWLTYGERRDTDPLAWLAAFHAAETMEARQFFAENAMRYVGAEQKEQWQREFAEILPEMKKGVPERAWAQDPAEWVSKLSPQEVAALPAEEAKELIRKWGQKNPRKALDWALAQGRPEAAHALDLLYYQEPKEAVELASGVPAGKERDEVLSTICDMAAFYGDEASARQLLPLISDQERQDRIRQAVEGRLKERKAKKR